ncbi:carbohydrate ABC transporter permease [Goodfellowiella coeruleoviolacea]|uniref:Cellobiose ABC transporter membrane protein n=1 Tax=Goodfellowiella coeruleoviolacea TaxID=334858 RepID=A0AAE3G8C9_9PSEU|nr:sugar ABC transporter permease [Goodfellowiella coeruleoviolacea]MCP2163591.1 cellobiose ABC transporter membrane protein [Goodfellowiella coeruleoviolacea]
MVLAWAARLAAPARRQRRVVLLARLDARATPLLFVAPFFVLFAVFGVFPLAYTAWISLHDWQLVNGDQGFVGLANYAALFTDPHFYNALGNTVSMLVLATVPQLFAGLGIAALLNRPLRTAVFWRAGVLLPNAVSVVAVTLVFAQLFGRDFGVANWVLDQLGVPPVDWQANRLAAHLAVAATVTWRWTGYNALLYLAAMQSVDQELYEAAELDGASRWRAFWAVTVPAIRPTIGFTAFSATVGGLQLFVEPQLFDVSGLGGIGGTDRQFQTITMYLYEKGFGVFDAGYAAAIAWVLALLCGGCVLVGLGLVRRLARRGRL